MYTCMLYYMCIYELPNITAVGAHMFNNLGFADLRNNWMQAVPKFKRHYSVPIRRSSCKRTRSECETLLE